MKRISPKIYCYKQGCVRRFHNKEKMLDHIKTVHPDLYESAKEGINAKL